MRYLKGIRSLEFNEERCTGCGRCAEVCPHGIFEIRDKKAMITDADLCIECTACKTNCAFGAVEVNVGVGCAAAIIHSMIYGGDPSCDCSGDGNGNSSSCC